MGAIKNIILALYLISFLSFTLSNQTEQLSDSCLNNSLCENTTSENSNINNFDEVHAAELTTNIFKYKESTKNSINTTETNVNKKTDYELNTQDFKLQKIINKTSKNKFCSCDLINGYCDINCCCDLDCTQYHMKVFSKCIDYNSDKEKDSWYCHEKPFFRKNDTRFLLEKIFDSLFCIASDNLPPIYSASSHLQIKDDKTFQKIINDNKRSTFKWKIDKQKISFSEFNFSNYYRHKDALWINNKNFLKTFELPQSGFGKVCDFKKTVQFLEDWKSFCYHNNLNNSNLFLFPSNFTNFTIIAVPSKFDQQYLFQECPKNICLNVNITFCSESWMFCTKNKTVNEFCSENSCYNVVKKIRYIIYHNGNEGIKNIEVNIQLANVSKSFKQEFEVLYKWLNLNTSLVFERSGNPGYIKGKSIFIGTQILNKTSNSEVNRVIFDKTYNYLTLPMANKNGICSEIERYPVKFLENIKLKCSIIVKSNNFSTSTCIKLQNRTFEFITKFMMFKNFEKKNLDNQFVSKSGNIFDNNTDSWAKIFFSKIPQNVITSQITENEIRCSGLVTSVMFDIVHSIISKPKTDKNHVILGIGVTFSQEADFKWSKCISKNCIDVLQLDIVSFVSFHDISKPTRYHIAGGPSLDISLPYNFFYPFLSHSKSNGPILKNRAIYNICIILYIIFNPQKFTKLF